MARRHSAVSACSPPPHLLSNGMEWPVVNTKLNLGSSPQGLPPDTEVTQIAEQLCGEGAGLHKLRLLELFIMYKARQDCCPLPMLAFSFSSRARANEPVARLHDQRAQWRQLAALNACLSLSNIRATTVTLCSVTGKERRKGEERERRKGEDKERRKGGGEARSGVDFDAPRAVHDEPPRPVYPPQVTT